MKSGRCLLFCRICHHLLSRFEVLPPLGGWEMRWRIQIVQIERDADDTCNFLEIPNLLGPLFLAGMQVVLSGIFTSMVLLNREEGQE